FVLTEQPLHPVHIWLASAEVLRVAFENCLHVRLVTLQEKGSSTDSALRFLQIAKLLHDFWRDDPHAPRVCQGVDEPDIGLFEEELHRITIGYLDPLHRVQQIAIWIP